jgi:hypothetical protein
MDIRFYFDKIAGHRAPRLDLCDGKYGQYGNIVIMANVVGQIS